MLWTKESRAVSEATLDKALGALATIRSRLEELGWERDELETGDRALATCVQELQEALRRLDHVAEFAFRGKVSKVLVQHIARNALNHEGKTTLAEAERAGVFGDRPADTCSNCGQTHGLGCEAVGCPCRCRQALNPSPDQTGKEPT